MTERTTPGPASSNEGSETLDSMADPYTFAGNVIYGTPEGSYPSGNYFPSTINAVGFVDLAGGNYRLAGTSDYAGIAENGRDPGADIETLESKLQGVR